MEKKSQATAKIQVTVQVQAGTWGSNCDLEQVYQQAGREGVEKIRKALSVAQCGATIIGEPRVIAVLTEGNP